MHRSKYTTGSIIPRSGIYRVFHAQHRLPHEVILIDGDEFPRCAKCSNAVDFQLVRAARAGFHYQPVRLYELPAEEEDAASAG